MDNSAVNNAIAGRYSLPKLLLLRKAWHAQATIGGGVRTALVFLLIPILPLLFLLSHALSYALLRLQLSLSPLETNLILSVASLPLMAPWITGLMLIGIDAARGTPSGFARVLECYERVVPLTLVAVTASIASAIGMLLFVLPGLYLLVGCTLALPLVVDAQLQPARAIMVSLQAIHHRWFDFAVIIALLLLTMFFSMVFVGLPLWLILPWQAAVIGTLYCAIFRTGSTTEPPDGENHFRNATAIFNDSLQR